MDYQRAIVEAALGWVAARTCRRQVARDVAVARRSGIRDAELRWLESTLCTAWHDERAAERRLELAITEPTAEADQSIRATAPTRRIPDHE